MFKKWLNALLLSIIFIKTPNMYPNIPNNQQFRLNKINEIKDYFIAEIRERELMHKSQ